MVQEQYISAFHSDPFILACQILQRGPARWVFNQHGCNYMAQMRVQIKVSGEDVLVVADLADQSEVVIRRERLATTDQVV